VRKVQLNDWKVTVAYANNGHPDVGDGAARYTVHLDRPVGDSRRMAKLVLQDAALRQLALAPTRNMHYITVGVWNTEGLRPALLAAASASFHEEDRCYEYTGTARIVEPVALRGRRRLADYYEWEKP
jgi:hypothetical protein